MLQKIGALQNRNDLIISGITFNNGENRHSVLKAIAKYLSVNDSTTLMAQTRRNRPSGKSDGDGLIVVEFTLKATRDEFYNSYMRKRDRKFRNIGLDSDRRVYINENLSIEAR